MTFTDFDLIPGARVEQVGNSFELKIHKSDFGSCDSGAYPVSISLADSSGSTSVIDFNVQLSLIES